MDVKFSFSGELWIYAGNAAWCFVTLPTDYANDIKTISPASKKGFGALRVKAIIGKEEWYTSIFPDTKTQSYVLPIKKEIREKCSLKVGDQIETKIALLDF